jgi:hypothetical protein
VIDIAVVRTWIQRVWAEELSDPERMAAEEELRQLLAEIEDLDRLAVQEEGEIL